MTTTELVSEMQRRRIELILKGDAAAEKGDGEHADHFYDKAEVWTDTINLVLVAAVRRLKEAL